MNKGGGQKQLNYAIIDFHGTKDGCCFDIPYQTFYSANQLQGFAFLIFFFQDQFQMKAWVLILVLIPLITFSNGRTRFRMVEYDEDQGHSRAYGVCMRQCKRECLKNEGECKHHPQIRELICRQGPKDGDWNGFKTFMDNMGVTKCEDFLELKPALKEDETKSKHLSFQPSEIWQLFE